MRGGGLEPNRHDRSQEHDAGKEGQLGRPRHELREVRAEVGSARARHAEQPHAPPVDLSLVGEGERTDKANERDDAERLGNRELVGLSHEVDEDRHDENRLAGAEEAEDETNEQGTEPGGIHAEGCWEVS